MTAFWRPFIVLLWLGLAPGGALAEVAIPPVARVVDQTATLTPAAIQAMEAELAALEAAKGSQIAVLLVPTTQPETIEQFGLRVAEAWKLGRKGVDDGALLLVAKNDRTLRIEVGYGLEGAIPDAVAKRVIEEIILPHFKAGNFAGGIEAGVTALVKLVEGEPLPPPQGGGEDIGLLEQMFPLAMVFIFLVGGALRLMLGRLPGALAAGGIAFVGLWLLLGSLLTALFFAFVIFFITLAGGAAGGIGQAGRRGGFGGGLGGGGFGGGGGFSGGGGGFGGGGASGRW